MSHSQVETSLAVDKTIARLIEGNHRFVSGEPAHAHQDPEHRVELRAGQAPFAIILGCADSRVPPELVFDQGLGDLFTVRVAGNVVDEMVLASIEYAAAHLHTPLVIVLGHTGCGAVQAVHEAVQSGEVSSGHLPALVEAIQPALVEAQAQAGNLVDNAVSANAKLVAHQLAASTLSWRRWSKPEL